MFTIKDITDGNCAVENDGTLEELKLVLKAASPAVNTQNIKGMAQYYFIDTATGYRCSSSKNNLYMPIQSVKEFLKQITKPYPKVMMVSNSHNYAKAVKRVVFMEKKGKYIAWHSAETLEDAKEEIATYPWNYAWDILTDQIVELTMEDISEGKGVGVPSYLLRIKE